MRSLRFFEASIWSSGRSWWTAYITTPFLWNTWSLRTARTSRSFSMPSSFAVASAFRRASSSSSAIARRRSARRPSVREAAARASESSRCRRSASAFAATYAASAALSPASEASVPASSVAVVSRCTLRSSSSFEGSPIPRSLRFASSRASRFGLSLARASRVSPSRLRASSVNPILATSRSTDSSSASNSARRADFASLTVRISSFVSPIWRFSSERRKESSLIFETSDRTCSSRIPAFRRSRSSSRRTSARPASHATSFSIRASRSPRPPSWRRRSNACSFVTSVLSSAIRRSVAKSFSLICRSFFSCSARNSWRRW